MTWYAEGLRFSCQRSGNCCTGAPGQVWVSEAEIDGLALATGLDADSFRRRYTRTIYRRGVSLTEKANNDCVFFRTGHGCQVYEQRPRQCRTWPFWRALLSSPEAWAAAAKDCPGIGKGRLHQLDEIEANRQDDGLPI
jgi:uncharacterized protein